MSTSGGSVDGATPRACIDEADRTDNAASQAVHQERLISKEASPTPQNSRRGNRARIFRTPSQSSVWRRGWKVPSSIIGFYILALLFAVAHHSLFIYLDGRVINLSNESLPFDSTDIPQSYATTFSFALVTAFRAAMVASVGMCYTQCLWKKLRGELLQIGLIEELFQIRNNVLRLFKPAVIWYAPLLLSVAVLSWLLPVAMIYPPGALTVELQYRDVNGQFNVSVMPRGPNFDPFIDRSGTGSEANTGFGRVGNTNEMDKITSNYSEKLFYYDGPQPSLKFAAKQVLASSKILELDHPSAVNSSYTLSFLGPFVRCRGPYERVNSTVPKAGDFEQRNGTLTSGSKYEAWKMKINFPTYQISHDTGIIMIEEPNLDPVNFNASLMVTPCPRVTNESNAVEDFGPPPSLPRIEFANETQLLNPVVWRECSAVIVEYTVNISITNGLQKITHAIGEEKEALPIPIPDTFHVGNGSDFGPMSSVQEYVNLLSIIDSLINNFDLEGHHLVEVIFDTALLNNPQWQNLTWSNGTRTSFQACAARKRQDTGMKGSSIMPVSVFNTNRLNHSDLLEVDPADFDYSEKLLNEALINITISSLSLGLHYEMVNGTSTRVFNVYRFGKRPSFYVPYGLCLMFTLPVIVVGLLALHHNGVTAIDGGFVQLLMTTTGRTELEDVAAQGCLGGEENVPKELKKLRVRFGEMITEDTNGSHLLLNAGDDNERENRPVSNATSLRSIDQEEDVDRARTPLYTEEASEDIELSDDIERGSVHQDLVQQATSAEVHQYGNVILRRAGFGLSDETVPLEKHIQYGRLKTGSED